MPKAIWNETVIAETDSFEKVEGNIYFPPGALKREYFQDSAKMTSCFWKGKARYYDVVVNGQELKDAAWYYPDPKRRAENIRDHVAFGRGVQVTD